MAVVTDLSKTFCKINETNRGDIKKRAKVRGWFLPQTMFESKAIRANEPTTLIYFNDKTMLIGEKQGDFKEIFFYDGEFHDCPEPNKAEVFEQIFKDTFKEDEGVKFCNGDVVYVKERKSAFGKGIYVGKDPKIKTGHVIYLNDELQIWDTEVLLTSDEYQAQQAEVELETLAEELYFNYYQLHQMSNLSIGLVKWNELNSTKQGIWKEMVKVTGFKGVQKIDDQDFLG